MLFLLFVLHVFTDNIFSVKSWAKKKFGFEEKKIDKTFGIPEEFDYIDWINSESFSLLYICSSIIPVVSMSCVTDVHYIEVNLWKTW